MPTDEIVCELANWPLPLVDVRGHATTFVRELSDRSQPVDAITMTDALRTRGKLEAIGGPAYIAELAACVPTASNVAHYARIVREKAVLRALASTATEIASSAYDAPARVIHEEGATVEDKRLHLAGRHSREVVGQT